MASKLSPAGTTRDKRKRQPKVLQTQSTTVNPPLPEDVQEPEPKKTRIDKEKNKESDEETKQPKATPSKSTRLRKKDFYDLEALVSGSADSEESEEEKESDDGESEQWDDVEEVSTRIKRKKKDTASSQGATPSARRRLSRHAKLEKACMYAMSFYSRIF